MNRTDRLYALVEELRAVAPRPRSAAWLARRFEVSVRTIERDLGALRESGVPIWSEHGRAGGYTLDRERTLAPLALTAEEALAVTVALRTVESSPVGAAARTAALKVRAGLSADVRRAEEALAERVHRVGRHAGAERIGQDLLRAITRRFVVRLAYRDAVGAASVREVEPLGLLSGPQGWYLVGWCRLRESVRGFRLDRIQTVDLLDERSPDRREVALAELRRLEAEPVGI